MGQEWWGPRWGKHRETPAGPREWVEGAEQTSLEERDEKQTEQLGLALSKHWLGTQKPPQAEAGDTMSPLLWGGSQIGGSGLGTSSVTWGQHRDGASHRDGAPGMQEHVPAHCQDLFYPHLSFSRPIPAGDWELGDVTRAKRGRGHCGQGRIAFACSQGFVWTKGRRESGQDPAWPGRTGDTRGQGQ